MSHITIIISSAVQPAPTHHSDQTPIVHAEVTYRPIDGTSPQECGKMVERILKRLPNLATAPAQDEHVHE